MYIQEGKIAQAFFKKVTNAEAKERVQLYYKLYLEFEQNNIGWEQIEQIILDSHSHKAHAKTFLHRFKIAYALKGEM